MDSNDTMQDVQADVPVTADDVQAAFDSGWEDDDQPITVEESGTDDTAETEGGADEAEDADQHDAEEDAGDEGETADADGEAEGDEGEAPDQGDESFTLRYLGEERNVGRDEVIRLAQQGMDYQRIREKWDAVKDDIPKLRMYESFLKELAESRNGDIEGLIDETRTRTMIARAEAKGETLNPSAAAAAAVRARLQSMQGRAGEPADPKARNEEMINRFVAVYGNSVDGKDIPPEVWEEAGQIGDLVVPYQRHLTAKTEAENKRLKKELQDLKQQQKNRERSTGSTRTEGAAASRDPFEEGWEL